jgi:hypothetical protein
VVQPGRIMNVIFDSHELFAEDSDIPRESRNDLIDRIVASMAAPAAGLEFEMVIILESPLIVESPLGKDMNNVAAAATETIEMKRVGAFLRLLIERGATPALLSGGLKPGSSSVVTIRFFVRNVDVPPFSESAPALQKGLNGQDDQPQIESPPVEQLPDNQSLNGQTIEAQPQ